MEFFKNIKNSIYGPNFYSEAISKPFSFSLKYYLLFALISAIFATIVLSFSVLPEMKSTLGELSTKVLQNYPTDLVVKIQNGKASTNAKEPFFVKIPGGAEAGVENLLAIDTKTPFDLNKFQDYKSQCLLTENSLICYDKNKGEIKIQSLEKFHNITINKALVSSWVKKASVFLNLLYPFFFIGGIIIFFMAITARLFYLLFFALLVWLVARLKKISIGYKKSYQLGMHLMTPAFIVTYFTFLFFPHLHVPYYFTAIAFITAIVNLQNAVSVENSALAADSKNVS